MKRIPEPELMTDEEQVRAYGQANFSDSNTAFVEYISNRHPNFSGHILDVGCGPADVDLLLATKMPLANILAIDGSEQMLSAAGAKIKDLGLSERIHLQKVQIPDNSLPLHVHDLILTKDLLHHLPDPMIFWREAERLASPQTTIYLMDLFRPPTVEEARRIVAMSSGTSPQVLQIDFYNSLLAAYTVNEITEQLEHTPFQYEIEMIGARHFIVCCTLIGD